MNPITLKPDLGQAAVECLGAGLLLITGAMAAGADIRYVRMAGMTACLSASFYILAHSWHLFSLSWIVTEDRIVSKKGVFTKTTDYMELYRVIDFQERQSFMQSLWGVRDIIITSGDKSHSVLVIKGIKDNAGIVDIINQNVEKSKRRRNVYEITNR